MKDRTESLISSNLTKLLAGLFLSSVVMVAHSDVDERDVKHEPQLPGQISPPVVLQDLVRAEAAVASTQLQQRDPQVFTPSHGFSTHDQRHEVRSIYGVGSRLFAELVLSSKSYLFLSGQSRPVQGPDRRWQLERIQPPCIHLKHDDKPTVLCLGVSPE